MIKQSFKAALISIAAACVVFAAMFAVAKFGPNDRPTVRRHIVEAIQNGEMMQIVRYGWFSPQAFYRNVYDCGFFQMVLEPPAAHPLRVLDTHLMDFIGYNANDKRIPPFDGCQILFKALPEIGGSGDVKFESFDRYILASRLVAQSMLSYMSVETMHRVLRALAHALIGIVLLAGLYRLIRAKDDSVERAAGAGYAALALSLLLFYGMRFFTLTLNFGVMDIVQFFFVALTLIWPLGQMRDTRLALFAGFYGGMIAIVEWLTGGIPLALAMMPLLLAFGYRGTKSDYLRKLFILWFSFCIAVGVCFGLKKVYTTLLIPDTDALVSRISQWFWGGPITAEFTFRKLLENYGNATPLIAWGSNSLGKIAVVVGVVSLVGLTIRRSFADLYVWACWFCMLALAAWSLTFFNHTVAHSHQMVRLLVIPIMAGAVLLAIELATWRTRGQAAAAAG